MAITRKSGTPGNGNGEVAAISPSPFRMMLHDMSVIATADENDVSLQGESLNAILSAETEDEIWEADDRPPLNFQHLAGCEIEIIDFQVKYSRKAGSPIDETPFVASDGRKMYLLVTAQRLSAAGEKKLINLPKPGEVFTANTSARYVAAKIWAFYAKGRIDPESGKTLRCLVQETDLGGDQAVLKLRPLAPAAVAVSAE